MQSTMFFLKTGLIPKIIIEVPVDNRRNPVALEDSVAKESVTIEGFCWIPMDSQNSGTSIISLIQ